MTEAWAVAEVLGPDRDQRARAARLRAERRERIASSLLAGMVSVDGGPVDELAGKRCREACNLADRLILELDRRLALELEAARR